MFTSIMKLLRNEDGATAIEYGLIAALIAVAAVTVWAPSARTSAARSTPSPASSKLRRKSKTPGGTAVPPGVSCFRNWISWVEALKLASG